MDPYWLPMTKRDPVTGLVHVVASDGVRFCGPFHRHLGLTDEPTAHYVTCLFCARQWRALREA